MTHSRLHWFFRRAFLEAMFRFALPLAARLPPHAGRVLAGVLGKLCARLDLDWRTLALREHYVAARTRQALREIDPGLDEARLNALVRQRFVNATLEELEGHWLALRQAGKFRCDIEGLDEIRGVMADGNGLVLLTLHFDATLMGVAQLGLAGVKLNLMTSDVVEDVRVLPVVQRYFSAKYAGIEACLNGGLVMHVEKRLKSFYRALRAGDGVVILGEAPTGRLEDALVVDFLGKRRAIAPGVLRLAEKTGAPMAAFVCLRNPDGNYRVVFSPPYRPENGCHAGNVARRLFAFLGARVRSHPERWWAADQLPNFINVDDR